MQLSVIVSKIVKKVENLNGLFAHRRFERAMLLASKYISPFLTITVASLTKIILDPYIEISPFIYFNIPILIHGLVLGIGSGILATFITAPIIFYFFLDPQNSLQKNTDQVIELAFFLVQALITVGIVSKLNSSRIIMKKVKETIDLERKRMQDIIDSIFIFIVVISPDGKIIEANKATRQLGQHSNNKTIYDLRQAGSKKNFIGKYIWDTYPWSHSSATQYNLNQSIIESLTGKQVGYDEVMRVNDDELMDVSVSIAPILNKNNKVQYIIISAADITQRKQYERELETVHQNYLKLINSNIIGMVISNKEGQMVEMNDAFLNMIGYTRSEVINQPLSWDDFDTTYSKEKEDNMREILEKGYVRQIEKELVHKNGSIVPAILSGIVIDDEEGLLLSIVLDITERKKLEKKKDEFLSIASHELKTPLTTLKGYVQLLGSKLEARQKENDLFISRMDNQLIKITDLINDLLDISRIQTGGLTFNESTFDIAQLAEDVVREVSPLTSHHQINFFKPSSPQIVKGDKTRIGQVIINLMSNAIKYSPDSDKINVYIQDFEEEVRIIIEDFGVGIPEDKIDRLFQKFYRVEENQSNWHQGLGLGLYISNEIVKRHGSHIVVKSEEGKGSIFYFNLRKAEKEDGRDNQQDQE